MGKTVKCGLIQMSNPLNDESKPVAEIQKAMVDKHIPMIEEAGKKGQGVARPNKREAGAAAIEQERLRQLGLPTGEAPKPQSPETPPSRPTGYGANDDDYMAQARKRAARA